MSKPRTWQWTLRPRDAVQMVELAALLEVEGYIVQTQPLVIETRVTTDGKRTDKIGRPQVTLFVKGVLSAAELKRHVAALVKLARAKGAVYDGLDCMSNADYKFLYEPPELMSLKDAAWLLRHYASTGMNAKAKLAFRFGFKTRRAQLLMSDLTAALQPLIKSKRARVQPAARGSKWHVEVIVLGTNSDRSLKDAYVTLEAAAKQVGVKLGGVLV